MTEPVLRIRHPQGITLQPPMVPGSLVAANESQWAGRPLSTSLGLACSLLTREAEAPAELDAMPFMSQRDRKQRLLTAAQSYLAGKDQKDKEKFRPAIMGIAAMGALSEAVDFSSVVSAASRFEENVRSIVVKVEPRPEQGYPRVSS